ncbi:hypothetical protein AMAG_19463 [Allomyces macrogynus ATCC 38327]|uniref:Uncharacterized protein n=1 Tax=Allomyces macrogynus (strain ATCC 38327) TaxID=578462 RepID=A0A0L0SSE1_ALLM3|nr:hypothetical protein AMAG_19463 [Allomyces macrogynus ATCC 38327]|eukprot:KNE65416.1 hypothetical protein AMAG_19463 [Allomyces macrogynus ATCC 38327]
MSESKLVVAKVSDALFETWAPRTFKGTSALGDLTAKVRAMHVELGQQIRAIWYGIAIGPWQVAHASAG